MPTAAWSPVQSNCRCSTLDRPPTQQPLRLKSPCQSCVDGVSVQLQRTGEGESRDQPAYNRSRRASKPPRERDLVDAVNLHRRHRLATLFECPFEPNYHQIGLIQGKFVSALPFAPAGQVISLQLSRSRRYVIENSSARVTLISCHISTAMPSTSYPGPIFALVAGTRTVTLFLSCLAGFLGGCTGLHPGAGGSAGLFGGLV